MCSSGGSPQRQRLACPECASRCIEVHGRTPGGEEPNSFFKIMLSSFRTMLFIPPKFGRNIEGLEDRKAYLQDSEGNFWKVKVRRIRNSLAFHDGWHQFVKDHNIDIGEFVVFNHIGGSNFVVQIFGTSGCIRLHFPGQHATHSLKRKTYATESSFDHHLHSHEGIDTISPSKDERVVVHEASTSIKKPAATPVALTNTSKNVVMPQKSLLQSHTFQTTEPTSAPDDIDTGGDIIGKTGTSSICADADTSRGIGNSMNKNNFQPDQTARLPDTGISITSDGLTMESDENHTMMIHKSDETDEVSREERQEIICSPDVLHDSEDIESNLLVDSKVNRSKHSSNVTDSLSKKQPSVSPGPEKPDNIVDEDLREKKKQKIAIHDSVAQEVGETKQSVELLHRSAQDQADVAETRSLYSVEASTGTKEEGNVPVFAVCACTNRELPHGDQRDECGESGKGIHVRPASDYSEVASNRGDMEKSDAPKSQETVSNVAIVPFRCKHEEKEFCFFGVDLEPGPACVITENEVENPTSLSDFCRIPVMEDGRYTVVQENKDDKSNSGTIAPFKMDNSEININSCKVDCNFLIDSTSNHMTCSEKSRNIQAPAQKLENFDPEDGNFPKERKAKGEHRISETELVPVKVERRPPCDPVKYSFSITMNGQPWHELSESLPSIRKRSERKVVLFRDSLMRLWPVLYHDSEKFVGFLGGWQAFASANKLQEGDVCMLEMDNEFDSSTFNVVISRK